MKALLRHPTRALFLCYLLLTLLACGVEAPAEQPRMPPSATPAQPKAARAAPMPGSGEEVAQAPTSAPLTVEAEPSPAVDEGPTADPATTAPDSETPRHSLDPWQPPTGQSELTTSIARGDGPDEVAVLGTQVYPSFRIGADGTIRILDPGNRRLLFFTPEGKPIRSVQLADLPDPMHFNISADGEIFVLHYSVDTPGYQGPIMRYAPDGQLIERIEVGPALYAEQIIVTPEKDVLLQDIGEQALLVMRHGRALPVAEQQVLHATASPRSSYLFTWNVSLEGTPGVLRQHSVEGGQVGSVEIASMHNAPFWEIDRAQNTYFRQSNPGDDIDDTPTYDIWRFDPAGRMIGGVRVEATSCSQGFARLYLDQAGTVWHGCFADQIVLKRYRLYDLQGQPLPDVP